VPQPFAEIHSRDHLGKPSAILPSTGQAGRQRDVLSHGQRGDQVERLKDEADSTTPNFRQIGL
jgi:hypothetical protein